MQFCHAIATFVSYGPSMNDRGGSNFSFWFRLIEALNVRKHLPFVLIVVLAPIVVTIIWFRASPSTQLGVCERIFDNFDSERLKGYDGCVLYAAEVIYITVSLVAFAARKAILRTRESIIFGYLPLVLAYITDVNANTFFLLFTPIILMMGGWIPTLALATVRLALRRSREDNR